MPRYDGSVTSPFASRTNGSRSGYSDSGRHRGRCSWLIGTRPTSVSRARGSRRSRSSGTFSAGIVICTTRSVCFTVSTLTLTARSGFTYYRPGVAWRSHRPRTWVRPLLDNLRNFHHSDLGLRLRGRETGCGGARGAFARQALDPVRRSPVRESRARRTPWGGRLHARAATSAPLFTLWDRDSR